MTIRRPIGESGGKTAFADRQSSELRASADDLKQRMCHLDRQTEGRKREKWDGKRENWRRGRRM